MADTRRGDLIHALMFSTKTEFVSLGRQNTLSEPTYSSYHVDILKQELDQINDHFIYPHFTEVDLMMQDVSKTIEQSFDTATDSHVVHEKSQARDLAGSFGGFQSRSSDLELFAQAGKATSIMIYRYAVQKLPFNNMANQNYLHSIINAISDLPRERWKTLKYFRLFM